MGNRYVEAHLLTKQIITYIKHCFMKKRILFLITSIIFCYLSNAQISTCPELMITLDRSEYCFNQKVTLNTNNDLAGRYFYIWRRDAGSTTWRWISNFGCGINCSSSNQPISILTGSTLAANSPLPNFGSDVFDLVISTSNSNPISNTACFSNIISNIIIHPIPNITVQPNSNNQTFCRNTGNRDTLWVRASGVGNVLDTLLSYQWYVTNATTSTAGSIISGETNRYLIPPYYQQTGGIVKRYYCQVSNQFGCGVKSDASGACTQWDTTKSTKDTIICDYQLPYFWNGQTLNAGGTYIRHFTSQYGCDSTAKLNLTVRTSLKKITTASICSNALPYYWDNKTYYNSTSDTVHRPNGVCDSLLILNLTVKPTSATTIYRTICDGAYVMVGTNKHFVTAVTTDILKNKLDCDSVVTLYLTVLPPTLYRDTTFKICPSAKATLNNKDYDKGGIYTDVIKNIAGCDSIVYHITIIELATSLYNQSVTVCRNTLPYFWNGTNYYNTGTYTKSFPSGNSVGCDSSAKLILVVKDTSAYTFTISICRDSSVTLWGTTYNTAGTYIKKLPNKAGCDSVITLVLTIKQPSASTTTAAICQTCSYTFNGTTYNTSGTYTHHLTNAVGCDSAATLVLTVGQITGDTVLCITDTAYYIIKNEQANNQYQWGVSGGAIYGSNTANPVKIKFDSTNNTYVTLTAKDSANNLLYSDTIWVKVGKHHIPNLATTGGVGCQHYVGTGTNDAGQLVYFLDSSGCTNVCEKTNYIYYAIGAINSHYNWNVIGGNKIIQGGDSVVVSWNNSGTVGYLTLTEITNMGCTDSVQYCFNIINSPIADIYTIFGKKDTLIVCKGQQVILVDSSNANGSSSIQSYYWDFGDGKTILNLTNGNVTHTYQQLGYNITTFNVKNLCGCGSTDTLVVFVKDTASIKILCERTVCENSIQLYTLDIPYVTGCSLDSGWAVLGGSILHNYGNAIEVKWDSVGSNGVGIISYDTKYCPSLCRGTSSIQIGVIKTKGIPITGDSVLCSQTTQLYTLPLWNNASYSWTVSSGATLINGSSPNQVFMVSTGTAHTVTLNCHFVHNIDSCSGDATMDITIQPQASLIGNNKVCVNDTAIIIANNTSGTTWSWQITNPLGIKDTLVGIDTLYFVPHIAGQYDIVVIGNNSCGSNHFILQVNATPAVPLGIVGIDSVCSTEMYTYSVLNPVSSNSYVWDVTGKASIVGLKIGNSVNVQYTGNPFTASVMVKAVNAAGCSSAEDTLVLKSLVMNNTLQNFDSIACPDSRKTYTATYAFADNYEWSIVPTAAGSVERGNGTRSITVLWNHGYSGATASIRLQLRKCGVTQLLPLFIVTLSPAPTISIISNNTVCRGSQYLVNLSSNTSLIGAVVQWNFGDGTTATAGSSTTHIYNAVIASPANYTITANITGLSAGTCTFTNTNIIATKAITINPSPQFDYTESFENRCAFVTGNNAIHVQFNNNYGSADSLIWTTPMGMLNCAAPFSSACLNYNITGYADTGKYVIKAVNSYGCFAITDTFKYRFYCEPVCVTDTIATLTVTGDTVAYCGHIEFFGSCSLPTYYQQWELYLPNGNKETPGAVTTQTSFYVKDFTSKGIYPLRYVAYYKKTDSALCFKDTFINIYIPLVPQLNYNVQCNSNSTGYTATIGDYSGYLAGTTNVVYDIYVDGSQVTNTSTNEYIGSIAAGAAHTMQIVVHYTYNGNNYTCSTQVVNLASLPPMPTASFSISNKHCQGIPIQFTYNGTYNSNYSYVWDFGDGASSWLNDPARVYSNAVQRNASLTVNNGYCALTETQNVTIVQNKMNGSIDSIGNYVICPNSSFLVSYENLLVPGQINTMPDFYQWYDARGVNFQTPFLTNTTGSYDIRQSGSYWLRIEDNNGCYKALNGNAIVLVATIETPVIQSSPAPASGDTLDICANNGFTLNAVLNNATHVQDYLWYEGSTLVGGGSGTTSNIFSVPANSLNAGQVYAYTVTTLNDIGTGQICNSSSRTLYVRVNAAPDKPVIDQPTALNCSNYTIGLTAHSSSTGIFSWSTGYTSVPNVTQSSTTVNTGNTYIVTLTSGLQCSSKDTVIVPNSATSYFSNLAKGCYQLCLPNAGLTMPLNSPSPVFTHWQWLLNWQPYTGGYNSSVQPLNILSSGTYTLVANNGLCIDTAFDAVLDITQPLNCLKEQTCDFIVTAGNAVWGATHDTAYIDFTIYNGNPQAIPFTLTTGTVDSYTNGGIAATGSHTYHIAYVMPAGGAGSTNFIFTFYYTAIGTPKNCSDTLDVCLDDCLPARPAPQPNFAKADKASSNLWLYPSFAKDAVTIQYEFKKASTNSTKQVAIYNEMGKQIAQCRVYGKGSLQVDVSQLPKGLYLVQLIDGGVVVQTEKLMVVR